MSPTRTIDLLAVDIDGTLITSGAALSVRNAQAIKRATAAGVHVVIATARSPRGTREAAELLGLNDPQTEAAVRPMINFNGALTWCFKRRGPIEHFRLSSKLAQSVIAAARSVEPLVNVSVEAADKWYTDRDPSAEGSGEPGLAQPDFIGPSASFCHISPTKLVLHADFEQLRRVWALLKKEFFDPSLATGMFSDWTALQVVAPGVNKGVALKKLAERLGIERQRVAAIGDAPNDLEMLRWAGVGVAVGNAWDEVKAAANITLKETNDEHAVAVALETLAGV